MKEYYIHTDLEQKGPLTLEELLKSDINGHVPVWYAGLEEWTLARNLEELKILFEQKTPPPFKSPSPPVVAAAPLTYNAQPVAPYVAQKKSGRGVVKGIIFLLVAAFIGFVLFVMYNRNRGGGSGSYTSLANYRTGIKTKI